MPEIKVVCFTSTSWNGSISLIWLAWFNFQKRLFSLQSCRSISSFWVLLSCIVVYLLTIKLKSHSFLSSFYFFGHNLFNMHIRFIIVFKHIVYWNLQNFSFQRWANCEMISFFIFKCFLSKNLVFWKHCNMNYFIITHPKQLNFSRINNINMICGFSIFINMLMHDIIFPNKTFSHY